jgi:hypothetical protein
MHEWVSECNLKLDFFATKRRCGRQRRTLRRFLSRTA